MNKGLFHFLFFSIILSAALADGQVMDSSAQWTRMGGSTGTLATASTTGIGQFTATNIPGARRYSATWTDTAGNFWLFGGYYNVVGNNYNDLWKYDFNAGQWAWMHGSTGYNGSANYGGAAPGTSTSSTTPGARYGSACWTDAEGNLWLFGGQISASAFMNDLWKYNTTTNQWTWISGNNTSGIIPGNYGTKNTAAASNHPGGRGGAPASWVDNAGDFWIFGGAGHASLAAPSGNLNDLWKYDPATGWWTWVSGSDQVNVTGDYGTQGTAAASNIPGGRQSLVSWKDDAGNFWLFGGYGSGKNPGLDRLNDIWKFNPSSGMWTWIKGEDVINAPGHYGVRGVSDPANTPGARYAVAKWVDKAGNLWVFGGTAIVSAGVSGNVNDLWKYDPVTNNWTWMKGPAAISTFGVYGPIGVTAPAYAPGARTNPSAWVDKTGDFWMFGGGGFATSGSANALNDFWRLAPVPPVVPLPFTTAKNEVCMGETGIVYTIPAVNGAATYEWVYSGVGVTFPGGAVTTAPSNTLDFSGSAIDGILSVRAVNGAGQGPYRDTAISIIPLPVVTVSHTGPQTVCTGDSLRLTATGSSGVVYEWKNGTASVGVGPVYQAYATGSYTVTVTDPLTNCSAVSTPSTDVTVYTMPAVSISPLGTSSLCSGDSLQLSLTGSGSMNIQWKNDNNNAGAGNTTHFVYTAGTYKAILTDPVTGCMDSTQAVSVVIHNRPVVSLSPGDTAFCTGGSVTLSVQTSDTGLVYAWSNSGVIIPQATADFLEISVPGVYTVIADRATTNNCPDTTDPVTITVYPLPVVTITWEDPQLHATPGYASYQWYNGSQPIPGATDAAFHPSTDGSYSVVVTDDNDCSNMSSVYDATVGVHEVINTGNSEVVIYPNPVTQTVYINATAPVNIALTSMDGRLLQCHYDDSSYRLNIQDYPDGFYLLRITDAATGLPLRNEKIRKQK